MVDPITPSALDALEQECAECLIQGGPQFMTLTRANVLALVAAARERDAWRQERDQCLAGAATVQKALTAERDTLRAENAELREAAHEAARLICCGEWGTGSEQHGEDCPTANLNAERARLKARVAALEFLLGVASEWRNGRMSTADLVHATDAALGAP